MVRMAAVSCPYAAAAASAASDHPDQLDGAPERHIAGSILYRFRPAHSAELAVQSHNDVFVCQEYRPHGGIYQDEEEAAAAVPAPLT